MFGAGRFGSDQDRLDDLVTREIDADELGAAGDSIPELGGAGVEHPEVVGRVDDDGLDADEVGLVGALVHEGVGVGKGAARPVVHLGVGVGDGFALDDLGDGEGDVVAPSGRS